MHDNKERFENHRNKVQEEQQPFLQLPLFDYPPEEYIRWLEEQEKPEPPPRVIVIDL
jgi:hypothetical protein